MAAPATLSPAVLLIFRDKHGDTFAPADLYFNRSDAPPLARAVDEFFSSHGPFAPDPWELVKAIELDPVTLAARDVTAAFLAELHETGRKMVHDEGYEYYGNLVQVDDLCQSHGFDSFEPHDPDGARRAYYEAKWHEAAP